MLRLEILTSYSFIIVSLATFILAMAAGAVGCVTVLKGESLIGDAIGHSAFPGIVLAFMIFMQRDPAILILGAIVSGTIAFILIQTINDNSKLDLDAILAVTLSSFFGLGMVFKSHIQGNSNYQGASQSGIQNYIFGQAAYIMEGDVKLIFIVAVPILLLLTIFYKEIKVFIFDEVYAQTIGLKTGIIHTIILLMTMSIIATGLKLVGAILISSMLIVPAIGAMQWTKHFSKLLLLAAGFGGVSAIVGTYISTAYDGMSTGPTIIIVMTLIAAFSLLIGPHGVIKNLRMRRNNTYES